MIRAVVDPGVLVGAAITPPGTCGNIVQAALSVRFSLVVCPALLAELEDVLLRPKFRRYLLPTEALRYVEVISDLSEHFPDPNAFPISTPDPDDDYLIALATDAQVDYLVSGDAHLSGLEHLPFPVLNPRMFWDQLG